MSSLNVEKLQAILKTAVGHLGSLRLPRRPWRSGRTDSHLTGASYGTPFVLSPELVEGSKHERESSHVTDVFRFIHSQGFV